MTEADLLCLKSSKDRPVEIETVCGERLTAKVLYVFEDDNAEVLYELISSSTPELYTRHSDAGGYSLRLADIICVKRAD
jgi:hypothetical protein